MNTAVSGGATARLSYFLQRLLGIMYMRSGVGEWEMDAHCRFEAIGIFLRSTLAGGRSIHAVYVSTPCNDWMELEGYGDLDAEDSSESKRYQRKE